jgi:hypothetical protein
MCRGTPSGQFLNQGFSSDKTGSIVDVWDPVWIKEFVGCGLASEQDLRILWRWRNPP